MIAKKPYHLVHLITGLNVGGAEMMLYKAVTRFNPEHFRSTLISMTKPGKIGNMLLAKGIPVLDLRMNKSRPNPLAMLKLFKILRGLRPHILHTYMYHACVLGSMVRKLAVYPL